MSAINLALPDKKYRVEIERGTLQNLGPLVKEVWTPQKVLLVSDTNVAPHYSQTVIDQLTAAGFQVTLATFPAGEASKNLATVQKLYQTLVTQQFSRSDGVLALGGGVVGDLAGFVAATYMRGIHFIQVPTSLLAQVDSSVGGKTGVDFGTGKNLVGAFYQPDLVVIDPDTLTTLSQRYLVEGYAEIVKMAAIANDQTFWPLIEKIHNPGNIQTEAQALIEHSVAFKAAVVMQDEKEGGLRQILNFGHTLGHAIELKANGQLAHGEAVSIGMVQLSRVFAVKGLTPEPVVAALTQQLQAVGLPINSPLIHDAEIFEQLKLDKKNRNGKLNLVYLKAFGQPEILPVATDKLAEFFAMLVE
ncbi:3-dehydroquinate synthase [Agrilactobacillus fermenti]|uniref:3-dehydroquinate synthase n=1 Tax=Agrilactobacillus fermenti TaxID=2586909 RepID=UPI001E4105DF|nr:3-dehydroquinate synthase [Agrilactobacillus fermenti]MCD2257522.1 3-dehydroquinate synthase [Agrilactobacillus fermenti]